MAGFSCRASDFVDLGVVPYPAVTVCVDLGDELIVGDGHDHQRGSMAFGLVPNGLRGRGRGIECLQLRLSPVIAYAVLGILPESDATSLDDLLGHRSVRRIEEQLWDARSWEERFQIAAAEIAWRYARNAQVDAEVGFAWNRIVRSRGQARIARIADLVGWSRQRLWARFRSQVGVGPKRAAQLVRFDHAAHRLAAGVPPALVAAEGGYADQSHLHRDVQDFAGVTPAAVAVAPWLAVDDVAWGAPEHAFKCSS